MRPPRNIPSLNLLVGHAKSPASFRHYCVVYVTSGLLQTYYDDSAHQARNHDWKLNRSSRDANWTRQAFR